MKREVRYRTKVLWILFCIYILTFGITDSAKGAEYQSGIIIDSKGFMQPDNLYDANRNTYTQCKEEGVITITNSEGIYGIYIEFDRLPQEWTLTNPENGVSITCGTAF